MGFYIEHFFMNKKKNECYFVKNTKLYIFPFFYTFVAISKEFTSLFFCAKKVRERKSLHIYYNPHLCLH